MKFRFELDGKVLEYERYPMQPGRFRALCGLIRAAIIGAVLIKSVEIVGTSAIVGFVVLAFFYGVYFVIQNA